MISDEYCNMNLDESVVFYKNASPELPAPKPIIIENLSSIKKNSPEKGADEAGKVSQFSI